jgi:hypothetical protein
MATFQENVDYIVNDKSTMDRFHVELTFTFDVTRYLQANTFRITIYDVMTHRDLTITADDLIYGNSYGLVPIVGPEVNPSTKAKQLDDSLIENDGIVIFFSGNVLTIVMIPRCSNDTKTIGFYSSSIYIQFSQDEDIKNSITFYAALFPKILRDDKVIQYDNGIDDPVFGANKNIRPAYDFNKNISKSIERFDYDTKEIFYANTTFSAHNEGEVPVYISKISAYGIDEYDRQMLSFEYDWENAKSYLIDEVDGTIHDNIPYDVVVPNSYNIEPVLGYSASIDNYLITQYIYRETPGFYKNKLVFELQNLPTSTALDRLVVTIEDLTPARYTKDSPEGTAIVKIFNPNVDYRDINLLKYDIIDSPENLNVEIDREHIDYSNYESYGEILIPLKNIHFTTQTKKADGQFGFEACISAEIAGMTIEQVETATYGCDYITTDFYTVRPELTKLQIELTWDPEYENNMIMPDESETVHVKITNNNLDYIDLLNYPINYTCTWAGEGVPLSDIRNLDTSNYDEYHYITFDVVNLMSDRIDPPRLTYLFEVTAYIEGSDPDVSPEISLEWMEDKTKNSAEVKFTLYVDVLEHLEFLENTLVYNPALDVDEEGNLVKVIKKNETQGFTIDLYNPNINHRSINDDRIIMTLYSPNARYFKQDTVIENGVHLEYDYDENYESKSDISGAGIIHVTVTNMHIDHVDIQKLIGLYAYINGHETETYARYEDGQFWTMDDPVIPHEWDYMKNYVIYTDSVLETENSYIGVRDIRCAGANFSFTNVESDVYCIGPLTINNHNMNPNLDYYCGNYPGITATGSSYPLNFYNNGNIKYNITVPAGTKKPMLYYYYNPEDPAGNNRFENTNNSVIGNDPYAGYADDGGMIITDRMVEEIKQLPIYPGTRTINLFQDVSYDFASHLNEFEYDAARGIRKANAFRASNRCTITLCPGEFHFNTFDADTYFTIIVPAMNDDEYVKIMVQGNINISNNLTIINYNNRMDSFLLYSNSGDISFAAAGDSSNPDKQIGLAVAPRGTISLSNKFIWKGGTWARKVIVQARSEYHLLPESNS